MREILRAARRSIAGFAWGAIVCAAAVAAETPRPPALSIRIVPSRPDQAVHPVFRESQIRAIVSPLLRRGCDAGAAAAVLGERYRFLGYVPDIDASCAGAGLNLVIRESSHRIDLITFDPADLARIGVTPNAEFEDTRRLYPVPAGGPRALLRALLETREGDVYNASRYANDRLALARFGYAIVFVGGAAREDDAYPAGAYLIQSLTPPPQDRPYRRQTNYLGGTGGYAPRAGGSVGLLYQKDEVFGRFDHLSVAPDYNSGLGGTISYRAPLLARQERPERLYDVQVDLFSTFQHNRDLLGVITDERRSGLGLSLGIRPLGLRPPNDLRLQVGMRYERLDLSRTIPGQDEERLTLLQLGATQEWRHTYRHPSLTMRLAPNIDFAIDRDGGQRDFVRPSLDVTLHQRMRSGFETDFHFLAGTIDRAVPSFEQWSLGGPTTVRGFREDSFLARDIVALQSELWIPFVRAEPQASLPPPEDGSEPPLPRFEPRAARLLRLALFVDGGAVGGVPGAGSTSIYGAGAGLRFVVPHQPLVLRLDYGWGLGGLGGDSFAYFSMAYRF